MYIHENKFCSCCILFSSTIFYKVKIQFPSLQYNINKNELIQYSRIEDKHNDKY